MGGLALGALLMPFGLALVIRPFLVTQMPKVPDLRIEELRRELASAVGLSEGGLAINQGYVPPQGLGLVVEDVDGVILLSTVDSLAKGRKAGLNEVAAAIPRQSELHDFFYEAIRSKGEERGRYFAWFTDDYAASAYRPSILFPLVLIGLGGIAFALGVILATSLGRDVLKLQAAAGRIASGDLVSEVRVGGVREIEELSLAMDGMRAVLKEDRDRRARFLASVSHDLRTPLTSISGYLEAVEDGLASDPATLSRYVSIMRDKTRLLEARISGLIEFARMDTVEWRMGFEPLELRPFLESLACEFLEDAALRGRSFSCELSAVGDLRVLADKVLLARAFENLISNAMRYSPERSAIGLSARRLGDGSLAIDVDDEGPGIPPAERERVFEPFIRGRSARQGEGSGLGLYIARSVFEGHGWTVRADEAPGGGGRISISIPAGNEI
jgi:signal transduction histidine kinase